ncbi:hypothetical protein WG906_00195 [Pedobacter sp. P351]|uniref:hypothetical protein n=1 Tax=Pedobacter superstes TaxID=3133441 RepID=UPI0030AF6C5E
MEPKIKSDKTLNVESELTNQPENKKEAKKTKKEVTGAALHDYAPKHSTHGRSNSRTFGVDHEPGAIS